MKEEFYLYGTKDLETDKLVGLASKPRKYYESEKRAQAVINESYISRKNPDRYKVVKIKCIVEDE